MNRRLLQSMPILISAVMIPQLLFWWLAPAGADAKVPIFIIGTLLTTGIPVICFLTFQNSVIRRCAGLLVTGGILEALTIAISAGLLIFNATGKSAVCSLLIMVLISVAALIPMIVSSKRIPLQGIGDNINAEMSDYYDYEDDDDDDSEEGWTRNTMNDIQYRNWRKQLMRSSSKADKKAVPLPARNR